MMVQRNTNRTDRTRGEHHPRARYSDAEVELVRLLHEQEGWGYKRIAAKMEMPRATVQDICLFKVRG